MEVNPDYSLYPCPVGLITRKRGLKIGEHSQNSYVLTSCGAEKLLIKEEILLSLSF